MDYQIRKLKLYNDIICSWDTDEGNGLLKYCTATVKKREFEYTKKECLSLASSSTPAEIPAGNYLFTQGFLKPESAAFSPDGLPADELYSAAEQLWLEFLWLDMTPEDNTIFVRLLLHENDYLDAKTGQKKSAGTVFQLYRRTRETF